MIRFWLADLRSLSVEWTKLSAFSTIELFTFPIMFIIWTLLPALRHLALEDAEPLFLFEGTKSPFSSMGDGFCFTSGFEKPSCARCSVRLLGNPWSTVLPLLRSPSRSPGFSVSFSWSKKQGMHKCLFINLGIPALNSRSEVPGCISSTTQEKRDGLETFMTEQESLVRQQCDEMTKNCDIKFCHGTLRLYDLGAISHFRGLPGVSWKRVRI